MAPMSSPVEALASDRLRIFQLHTEGLGDNSYVLTSAGEAIVVDPQRDLDRFFELLSKLDARLVGVLETHLHNDYVSGGPALATAKGAPYHVPAGAGFEVNHTELGDGDELQVGSVRLRALSTPGHTRHHMSYAALEGDSVVAVFTGGSMLVGACGRTDLVGSEWTTSLAEDQYRSSRRLSSLPEQALILPTHGAGSFCAATEGGSARWSTVGEERQQNPAIKASDVRSFINGQLGGLLAYPAYYSRMAGENRAGRAGWEARRPPNVSAERACDLIGEGVRVLDGRPRRSFAEAHIPGSVNIELDAGFATYDAWPRFRVTVRSTPTVVRGRGPRSRPAFSMGPVTGRCSSTAAFATGSSVAIPSSEPVLASAGQGIVRLRLPMPFELRHVNVYLLEDDDAWTLIDTGLQTDESRAALNQGLKEAGIEKRRIRRILVTHIHPDHVGLAAELQAATGAELVIHRLEVALMEPRYARAEDLVQEVAGWLRVNGVPGQEAEFLKTASMAAREYVGVPRPDLLLEGAERLRLEDGPLLAVWTPGHSPGHCCFFWPARRLLFSGDHLLPTISPNIGLHPQSGADQIGRA